MFTWVNLHPVICPVAANFCQDVSMAELCCNLQYWVPLSRAILPPSLHFFTERTLTSQFVISLTCTKTNIYICIYVCSIQQHLYGAYSMYNVFTYHTNCSAAFIVPLPWYTLTDTLACMIKDTLSISRNTSSKAVKMSEN